MKGAGALALMLAAFGAVAAFLGSTISSPPGAPKPSPAPAPSSPHAPPWNPPPPGRVLLQSEVTPAMTAWAQALVKSAEPMHSVHPQDFDGRTVLGRVEWHTFIARTGEKRPGGVRAASLYWPPQQA